MLGLRQHGRARCCRVAVLVEPFGYVAGEADGFVEGDTALHMVAEEDPLVRLLVDGGLRQDAQGSVGPGDDADVVGMLAVGVVEKFKQAGLLVQVCLLGRFVACGRILADGFSTPALALPSVPSATGQLGGPHRG